MAEPTQALSTFVCPHCGALYEVSIARLRVAEKANASCKSCGKVMVAWDTANVPSFRLIKRLDRV
jgi:predicted Zn finger-like uncharacterized protein